MPASRRRRVGQSVMSSGAEADGSGAGRPQADEQLDQLGLAVALDAGDADDLALVQVEGHVVEQPAAALRAVEG